MAATESTPPAAQADKSRRLAFAAVVVLFHALLFCWVGWQIRPAAGFQRNGPLFFLTPAFFNTTTSQPGGYLEYAAAACGQLDCANWLGAAAFTTIAVLAFLATRLAWMRLTGRAAVLAPFLTAVLLLWLRQQHGHAASVVGLGLVLALLLALLTDRLPGQTAWLRLATVLIISPLLAFGGGLWPWLLFMVTGVWLQARRRPAWPAWAGLLLGTAAAAVALVTSDADPAKLLAPWPRTTPTSLAVAVYLWLPASAALVGLKAVLTAHLPAWLRTAIESPATRRAAWVLAGLAAVAGSWLSFDRREHLLAGLEYASVRGDHAEVLRLAAQLPALPADAEVRLHRALYHSGRLLTDLFAYTNQIGWTLLPGMEGGSDAARAQAETLLELGQVNEAEHMAHEVLEFEGDRPDMLRLLADANVLKDRPQAARVFLRVLQGVPAHRKWATARLQALETDPSLANDARLGAIRACMVSTDLPHDGMPTATLLDQLLHSNPCNRMALEYLIAHRLLTLDLDRFVPRLAALQQFGYAALPRHCEEALLLQQALRPQAQPAELPPIRPETRERFRAWREALEGGALRTEAGRHTLARQFGDTYWYYHMLHFRSEPASTRAANP